MSDTFTHSSGTAPLVNADPIIDQTQYQLTYTITGRTAGSITITFGGATTGPVSASGILIDTTRNSSEKFTVTPTSNFDGTCTFSLRTINHYRSSCQWTELVGSFEDCADTVLSEGLWEKYDPEPCSGTNLIVNTGSEYFVTSEYNQTNTELTYVVWIYSDVSLFGTILGIELSTLIDGEYQNELRINGLEGGLRSINFTHLNEYADIFIFEVSAIQFYDGPKRTFSPISCFALGAAGCA